MAASSDILIENFRAGTLTRYGLDYVSLKTINPDLILVSVTGFGHDSAMATLPAVDPMIQAMSGMMSLTGEPDGEPQRIGFVISDLVAGFYAAIGALAALRHREIGGGGGQEVSVTLLDSAMAAMSHRVQEFLMTGVAPLRTGADSRTNVPSGQFAAADGVLSIQAGQAQFKKLCAALLREDLLTDPRFATRSDRTANHDELLAVLGAILATNTVRH